MSAKPPLDGVRVVELGGDALSGLIGMVLADFGAQVFATGQRSIQTARPVWARGKHALEIDSSAIRDAIEYADIVVTSWSDRQLGPLGFNAVERVEAGAIVCLLSSCGRRGRYANLPVSDALAAARIGRVNVLEGIAARPGPVFPALQVATHATSQAALSAILAAVAERMRTHAGRLIETTLLHGLLAYEMNTLLVEQLVARGLSERVVADPHTVMPTLNYHPVRCKDGRWLQLGNLLPHLFDNFLEASGLDAIAKDPWFSKQPWDNDTLERYRALMLEHMQKESLDTWQSRFVAHGGVASHPWQTTREALRDPDILANGHSVEVDGRLELGVVARLTRTPGQAGLRSKTSTPGKRIAVSGRSTRGPLDGVTVVEAATIIAAPFGAAILADLGARVIKLEPPEGDPFRNMLGGVGADRCNTGKESVCLDLKHPLAQSAVRKLVNKADIFIHNYRPGVPERLGLDYQSLSALNPRLVHVSANGYGPNGPGAKRPSTHPIPGAAMGGALYQFGELPEGPMTTPDLRDVSRRMFRANEVNPDPNTSVIVATAAMLGYLAAVRDGVGQAVYVDMFGTNAYANFDDFADNAVSARSPLDSNGYGRLPRQRLYACSSGWLMIDCDESAWARLLNLVCALDLAALEAILATRTSREWESWLLQNDIPSVACADCLPGRALIDDPDLKSMGLLATTRHPLHGDLFRHAALVMTDGVPGDLPPCLPGDSTLRVLEEIGISAVDIHTLTSARL